MLTQQEFSIIEFYARICSRVAMFDFDWNTNTKRFQPSTSKVKRVTPWVYLASGILAVLHSFHGVLNLYNSREHLLKRGLQILYIVLAPGFVLMLSYASIVLFRRQELMQLFNQM